MSIQLFNPFENLYFDANTCFLSGEDLTNDDDKIYVFPKWLMDKYDYWDKEITMMDKVNSVTFKNMKLPCSKSVKEKYEALEKEMKAAFEGGYEAMKVLDTQKLFLWAGKIVYGVLYHELYFSEKNGGFAGDEFSVSSVLKKRFSLFHLMLQSLISPVYFDALKPWSITLVRQKFSQDILHYRDDAVNLLFSLSINGFGFIICLQDNGIIKNEHQHILDLIDEKTVLHPIQFEELCARFVYSGYLMDYKPEYKIKPHKDGILVKALVPSPAEQDMIFRPWKNTMFTTLLENYWKPWGLEKKDIAPISPEDPKSFLENEISYNLVKPESIDLPF